MAPELGIGSRCRASQSTHGASPEVTIPSAAAVFPLRVPLVSPDYFFLPHSQRKDKKQYSPWQTFHTPSPRAMDGQSQIAKLMGYGSPGGQEKQLWLSYRTALPSPRIRAQGARVSDRPG